MFNGEIKMIKDWHAWRKLSFYFEHELEEGEITEATYKVMDDALLQLKPPLADGAPHAEIREIRKVLLDIKSKDKPSETSKAITKIVAILNRIT